MVIQHDEAFTTGTLTYCGTEGEKKSISFSCTEGEKKSISFSYRGRPRRQPRGSMGSDVCEIIHDKGAHHLF